MQPVFETIIKHGNAIEPYRIVDKQTFHTEFAALLYGRLECTRLSERDQYHYWSVSGHLA